MAFAVYIGTVAAFMLFLLGIIILFVSRRTPEKRKWGWVVLALSICAMISAIVNANGVFY